VTTPRNHQPGRKVSTLQARFRELAADPRGEPDPVLDRLTYHAAPAAAAPPDGADRCPRAVPGPAAGPQNEAKAEPEAEAS
jgi:hypothetical protein